MWFLSASLCLHRMITSESAVQNCLHIFLWNNLIFKKTCAICHYCPSIILFRSSNNFISTSITDNKHENCQMKCSQYSYKCTWFSIMVHSGAYEICTNTHTQSIHIKVSPSKNTFHSIFMTSFPLFINLRLSLFFHTYSLSSF